MEEKRQIKVIHRFQIIKIIERVIKQREIGGFQSVYCIYKNKERTIKSKKGELYIEIE
jgi:hypothetical protein